MKKPLSILLLCTLILAPLSLAQSATLSHPQVLASTSVDVPVWSVGNNWTYDINNITVDVEEENFTVHVHAAIEDFTMEVVGETTDYYLVHVKPTAITGDYAIYANLGDGPINVTGLLKKIVLEGTLQVAKADLGIKRINLTIDGKLTITVHEQPYFPPLSHTFTFSTVIDSSFIFGEPYRIIVFPLEVGNNWGIPANTVTLSGTIDSPWFKLVNFINQKVRQWHLIGPLANLLQTDEASLQNISDILDDILPTVDIAHVMNTYLSGNTINTSEIPPILICNDTEVVTVPAGTYTAYNITTLVGGGMIYYAPDAGYLIRMKGRFADALPFINGINMELASTNYQP